MTRLSKISLRAVSGLMLFGSKAMARLIVRIKGSILADNP